MAVVAKISSGFKFAVDITPTGTTFVAIRATVDFAVAQRAPRQDKTKQRTTAGAGSGIRDYIPGLRERELNFSLRWDQAHSGDATSVLHADLWKYFLAGMKMNWRLTYPPAASVAGATPLYVGVRKREFQGVMTSFQVRGPLGEVMGADIALQICGVVTEGTATEGQP